MTLQEVANQLSIGKASAFRFYTHKKKKQLGMSKESARWVPNQLTEDQKASRVTIAKEHLRHFNHDENKFLNWFVTRDEISLRKHACSNILKIFTTKK